MKSAIFDYIIYWTQDFIFLNIVVYSYIHCVSNNVNRSALSIIKIHHTMFTIYTSIFLDFILFIMFIFEQHIDEMLFVALYLTYDLKKTLVFACISTLICSCPHDKFQVMDSKFNKPLQADVKITPYPYLSSIINQQVTRWVLLKCCKPQNSKLYFTLY